MTYQQCDCSTAGRDMSFLIVEHAATKLHVSNMLMKRFVCLSRVRKRANLVDTERVRVRLCLKIQNRYR
jgi:hypothetical protein